MRDFVMNSNKRSLVILMSLFILSLCFGIMTACSKVSSVEVLTKKKITGHTVAVCKFPDKTIRLALKTQNGYKPFFTMYKTDIDIVPVENIQIQTGYTALEHNCFRVKFYMQPFEQYEYEMAYFSLDKEGEPLCLAICKNQVYLADLDGDNDSEIITVIKGSEKAEYMDTVLVYDWQSGKVVLSNVNESARQVNNLPNEAIIDINVELPQGYDVGYPDANIFPEDGAYLVFRYDYYIPPDGAHRGSRLLFKDLVFEPFNNQVEIYVE